MKIRNWKQFNESINEKVDPEKSYDLTPILKKIYKKFNVKSLKELEGKDKDTALDMIDKECDNCLKENVDYESMNEALSKLQKEYREYFKFLLKCYDTSSPAKLSDEKKKEFFKNVKKYWTKGKGTSKSLEDIKKEICGKDED